MERQYKPGLEKISSKVKSGLILATAISALTLNSGCTYLRPPAGDPRVRAYEDLKAEEQKSNAGFFQLLSIATEAGYGASR